MSPFRGIGSNTALRDAALLRDVLSCVNRGEPRLLAAVAAYEREAIDHAFAAASLAQNRRGDEWTARTVGL
jgi:2-polyprenyl-6-methoxyphenol hydroxylase-like FAD-dependent oxidoreductase